jgi:predicted nucleic acid-binding protein
MIVIDASVAVKWFSSETGRLAALALLEGRDKLIAPALIRVEVAGALVKKVRTGQVALGAIEAALATWYEAAVTGPLVTVPDDHDLPDASRLALELGHPIYDCLYLALANRYSIPLVTADAAFADRVVARFPNVRLLA